MLKIERAKIDEAEAISELLRRTWVDTYGQSLPQSTVRQVTAVWHHVDLLKSQIGNPKVFFGVAKDEASTIIGLITARSTSGDGLVIQRLYVSPEHQRIGVGTKLLAEALAAFGRKGKISLQVLEHNPKGFAFWRKQGFREVRRGEIAVAQETIRVIDMEHGI